MSNSKRIRLDLVSNSILSRSEDIFFNYDLLSIILTNFHILEIIKFIQINSFIYNYIKINDKSLYTIKKVVKYDFGDILTSEYFSFRYKTSLELIQCVYRDLARYICIFCCFFFSQIHKKYQ